MAELIGVIDSFNALRPSFLKRTSLLFERIALPEVREEIINQWQDTQPNEANELFWLIEQGIVFQVNTPTSTSLLALDEEDEKEIEVISKDFEKSLTDFFGEITETSPSEITEIVQKRLADPSLTDTEKLKIVGHFVALGQDISRLFGCFLRAQGVKAYPVLPFSMRQTKIPSQAQVIEIVFKNLPTPSEKTPWEQIIEYRSDPESRAKFLDLRNWINEITRDRLPRQEVSEKLEYLLSQYERQMNLHKMKSKDGVIESVVVTTAEIAENLLKLKWGKLAKMAFSMRQRKIALMEGELTSPGSEVAYILKTQQTFS